VIVDLRFTGVYGEEGLKIIKYVKEFYPQTNVILVTGYGSSLNIRLSPSMFSTSGSREKFIGLLKGFVMNGNMHIQFNVIDGDTLKDAQQRPQMYTDMVVRVSGYSAYFTDLGRPLQDDLIRRTQFDNY